MIRLEIDYSETNIVIAGLLLKLERLESLMRDVRDSANYKKKGEGSELLTRYAKKHSEVTAFLARLRNLV